MLRNVLTALRAVASKETFVGGGLGRNCVQNRLKKVLLVLIGCFPILFLSVPGICQDDNFAALPSLPSPSPEVPDITAARFDVSSLPSGAFGGGAAPQNQSSDAHPGRIKRAIKRTVEDQKELYKGPFKPSNFKWDAIVLAGTAGLLITDRHIENHIGTSHYQAWQNTSNISIAGLSAALAGVWIYGIKTDHHHARETGFLELETLVDTFLIYTPMQLIAGRQRPGEGTGHGDFLKHHAINTSFPGGHAMFTFAMATVVSHEYSQKWVQALAYTAATAVTVSRFMARDHWASDMFVGSALGIGIGAHVFHAHCDPELSDSCKHHTRWIF
jgi:PAP2 superfamily